MCTRKYIAVHIKKHQPILVSNSSWPSAENLACVRLKSTARWAFCSQKASRFPASFLKSVILFIIWQARGARGGRKRMCLYWRAPLYAPHT